MKSIFSLALLVCFLTSTYGQDVSIYKEIAENYYARQKANVNFKLIKSEISNIEEVYKYQSDSILFNRVEKLLRKTYEQFINKSNSQAQRDACKELLPLILEPYFSAQDILLKKDMRKVKLVKGNIVYSKENNFSKENMYEAFILVLELNNDVITNHIID